MLWATLFRCYTIWHLKQFVDDIHGLNKIHLFSVNAFCIVINVSHNSYIIYFIFLNECQFLATKWIRTFRWLQTVHLSQYACRILEKNLLSQCSTFSKWLSEEQPLIQILFHRTKAEHKYVQYFPASKLIY